MKTENAAPLLTYLSIHNGRAFRGIQEGNGGMQSVMYNDVANNITLGYLMMLFMFYMKSSGLSPKSSKASS